MKTIAFPPAIERLEARIAPAQAAVVNLAAIGLPDGFKINGEATGDVASVTATGDINGDGIPDVIVGARGNNPSGFNSSMGAAYVVFGTKTPRGPVELSALDGSNGFKIVGAVVEDQTGNAVAAGDINGDGIADVVVGAYNAGGDSSGAAYVVFGKRTAFAKSIELATLFAAEGFKISGEAAHDQAGWSVAAPGDVNDDGIGDLVIGAPYHGMNDASHAYGPGATYVIFGQPGTRANIALASLDAATGFKISGAVAGDATGGAVAGAGDLNHDGVADIVVGAPWADPQPNGNQLAIGKGTACVIFGKAGSGTNLSVSNLDGNNGFAIKGDPQFVRGAGLAVAAAGDVNGDGVDEVLVSANMPSTGIGSSSGIVYIVFGKKSPFAANLELSTLAASDGEIIEGNGDLLGGSMAAAGDINHDGFADVILGGSGADSAGAGAAYVVFGSAAAFPAHFNVADLNGANGFKIAGAANFDGAGVSVNSGSDLNDDGQTDFVIGAQHASPNGEASGAVWVVYGHGDPKLAISRDGRTATFAEADGDRVSVKVSKGTLTGGDFVFAPNDSLAALDLHGQTAFKGANLTITATKVKGGTGDGLVNVGAIDASGIDLGVVSVSGDLGKIVAGDADLITAGVRTLTVGGLGVHPENEVAGTLDPLHSIITGSLGTFAAKHNVAGFLDVTGGMKTGLGMVTIGGNLDGRSGQQYAGLIKSGVSVGAVTVKGSVIGGAAGVSGILSLGKLGKVTIGGSLTSVDAAKPVVIRALGKLHPATAAAAVAMTSISVAHDVLNARILSGYDVGNIAANPDAGIGAISVGGNWGASSVAAGVKDATGDGFGQNDTPIAGDTTPAIFATIASITIKGAAIGSATAGDFFGLTAQHIGALKIDGLKKTLTPGPEDLSLDTLHNDFHLVTL